MPHPRVRRHRTTSATWGATASGNTRAPTTAKNTCPTTITRLPGKVEPAPTPAPCGHARRRQSASAPGGRRPYLYVRALARSTEARAEEERTERGEDAHVRGSDGSSPAGFASVTRRAGAKRRTPE